jgi:hypothetical protein
MQPGARRALFISALVLTGIAQLGLSGSAGFAAVLVVLARSHASARPVALTAPVVPPTDPTPTAPTATTPTTAAATTAPPATGGGGGGGGGGCVPVEVITSQTAGNQSVVRFQAFSPAEEQACRGVSFTIWFGSYDTGAVYHLAASSSFVIHLGESGTVTFGGRRDCGYWEVVQYRPLAVDVPASQPNDGPTIMSRLGPPCVASPPAPTPTATASRTP